MNSRSLLILILFFLWGAGSTYWYTCKIKGFCQPQEEVVAPVKNQTVEQSPPKAVEKTVNHGLVYYLWGKIKPHFSDNNQWEAEVKSLKQLQAEGKKLRIEAPYFQDEPKPEGYDNLGLARADAIKRSLASQIDTALVITRGRLIKPTPNPYPEFVDSGMDDFNWVTFNDFVQEEHGKTLIYFPFNSTREIRNKDITSYLKNVSKDLEKNPNVKILIVGFTDSIGNEASNKVLGLKRANRIKNVLLNYGVADNRIIVKSEGKNMPIADNNTEEGRQKNRRVEISYIKN